MLDILKMTPSVAGAISFGILGFAFIHELAFFYVVGIQFQSFMSVTDYFNSAVSWLPWAAVGVTIGAFFALSDPSRHLSADFYKAHRRYWWRDRAPQTFIAVVLVIAGLVQFLFGNWYARPSALELFFALVWWRLVQSWVKSETRIAEIKNQSFNPQKSLLIATLVLPPALFFAFMGGITEGAAALTARAPVYYALLKGQDSEREWFVLRIFSSGAIVRDLNDDRIKYVKWDDLAAFQSKIPQINKNGLICRVFGRACDTGIYQ